MLMYIDRACAVHCGWPTDVMYVYVDCCYVRAVTVSSLKARSYKNAATSKSLPCDPHSAAFFVLVTCGERSYLLHICTKHSMEEKC